LRFIKEDLLWIEYYKYKSKGRTTIYL